MGRIISDNYVVSGASATSTKLGRKWRHEVDARSRESWEDELKRQRQLLRIYGSNERLAAHARKAIEEIEALLDPQAEVAAARAEMQRSHPDHAADYDPAKFDAAKRRLKAAKEKARG